MAEKRFEFEAELWLYSGDAAWHFLTVPREVAEEIRFFHPSRRRGWGSVRVLARIGGSQWKTSIFPDRRSGSFLLPVKAAIRKQERLVAGQICHLTLAVE